MSWPHTVFRMLVVFVWGSWPSSPPSPTSSMRLWRSWPTRTIPPNPAKAPWYFLGLQEIVSYSALAGGVIVPAAAIIGLMTIPYVDRNPEGQGTWFTSGQGRRITLWSIVAVIPVVLVLTWLNEHYAVRILVPGASQIWVDPPESGHHTDRPLRPPGRSTSGGARGRAGWGPWLSVFIFSDVLSDLHAHRALFPRRQLGLDMAVAGDGSALRRMTNGEFKSQRFPCARSGGWSPSPP